MKQSMRVTTLQDMGKGAGSARHETRRRGIVRRLGMALLGAALLSLVIAPLVEAVPKRIIILRHGEKQNGYALCPVGQQRSLALRANFLGKDAANSLFPSDVKPDAIFAVTLHCLELISPTAQSWGLPIQLYSVVPRIGLSKKAETLQLNRRTRQAANALLTDPRWDGKTVVVVWEHDHIANTDLEIQFKKKVTLRQLLNLDVFDLPDWYGGNYDYFWIVDYENPGSAVPTKFTSLKQEFPAPYEGVPQNDWGTKENLPDNSTCEQ